MTLSFALARILGALHRILGKLCELLERQSKCCSMLNKKIDAQTALQLDLGNQIALQGKLLAAQGVKIDEILSALNAQFRSLVITYRDEHGNPIPKEIDMLQLTDIQSVSATVTEVDAKGNPVPLVDGATVAWSVSDPTVLSLSDPAANPVTIAAVGPLSAAGVQVAVTVTNPDGSSLNAQDTVTVVASAATGLGIQFGTPA